MIDPLKIQVRFSDLDLMGHVNNAIYLSYFEMARVHYFNQLLGLAWDWKHYGVVIARNEIDYKQPVFLNDNPVVSLHTEFIGVKSFGLQYKLLVNDSICASGKSILVCYDSLSKKSINVPEQLRNVLNKLPLYC